MTTEEKPMIIVPPPTRKGMIDKTAYFVAKNGRGIEESLLAKAQEKTAQNFTFLLEEDPYHQYYLAKVEELAADLKSGGTGTVAASSSSTTTTSTMPKLEEISKPPTASAAQSEKEAAAARAAMEEKNRMKYSVFEIFKPQEDFKPREREFYVEIPPDLNARDLEIIKLTARTAAREGKRFESDLASLNTPMYRFVSDPYHAHHAYFRQLVASYRAVEDPNSSVSTYVDAIVKRPSVVLSSAMARYEAKRIETEKAKATANPAEERARFMEIDWHDFVVVETIVFDEDREGDAAARSSSSSSSFYGTTDQTSISVNDIVREAAAAQTLHDSAETNNRHVRKGGNDDEEINLVRDYRVQPEAPRLSVPRVEVDGRAVGPANEMSQHLRAELKDPKWRENQDRFEKKQRESNIEADAGIYKNLARMAGARPDVFGGEAEAAQRRYEEAKRKEGERLVWDGSILTMNSYQEMAKARAAATAPLPPPAFPGGVPPLDYASSSSSSSFMPPTSAPPVSSSYLPPPPPPKRMRASEEEVVEKSSVVPSANGSFIFEISSIPTAGAPASLVAVGLPSRLENLQSESPDVDAVKSAVSRALGNNVAPGKFQFLYNGQFLKSGSSVAPLLPPGSIHQLELRWKVR